MEWLNLRGRPALAWSQYFMLLIAGLLVSIFLGITAQSTTVNAVDPAQWKSQNLVYDGATYVRQTDAAKLKGMGLSEGAVVYALYAGLHQRRVQENIA